MSTVETGPPASSHPAIIELHFGNSEGRVRVVPPDRDIMILPVEFAMEACRAFSKQIQFKNQFDQLVDRLATWLADHEAPIASAYLTTRDSGLMFLVIQKGKTFDNDLESALTDLDWDVANESDFNLIRFSVHALPNCEECVYKSFLARNMALRFVRSGDRS